LKVGALHTCMQKPRVSNLTVHSKHNAQPHSLEHKYSAHLWNLAWVCTVHAIHICPDADVAAAKQRSQGSGAQITAVAFQGGGLALQSVRSCVFVGRRVRVSLC